MRYLFVFISVFVFYGCAAVSGHGDAIAKYNQDFISGDCENVSAEYLKRVEKKDDIILSANQAASLARKCGDYVKSNELFDTAESGYRYDVDEKGVISKSGSEIGSALVNENVLDYEGFYYERVMTNIYKALNFMSLKDFDSARVELNRALERERLAKEMYEKELEEASQKLKEGSANGNEDGNANERIEHNEFIKNDLIEQFGSFGDEFKALPDFINPFTSYLAGVFFYLDGDSLKAADIMKEALKMQPENPQILSDFELIDKSTKLSANKLADNGDKQNPNNHVWVIYENGKTLSRDEKKLNLPLFVLSTKMPHVGGAITRLGTSAPSYEHLVVNNKQSVPVSELDLVVKSEYKKQFPLSITRMIVRAITKASAQLIATKVGKEAGGNVGALIGSLTTGIYSMVTNRSDVRYWSSLPMRFEALRLDGVDDSEIEISDPQGIILKKIFIPKNKSGIIYIKSLEPAQVITHTIFK